MKLVSRPAVEEHRLRAFEKSASGLCGHERIEETEGRTGSAVAQAVSRWPFVAESRVWAWISPSGICGVQ
jgi:hypothetical protein